MENCYYSFSYKIVCTYKPCSCNFYVVNFLCLLTLLCFAGSLTEFYHKLCTNY